MLKRSSRLDRLPLCVVYADLLYAFALVPGADAVFEISVNDELVWSRTRDGGFPDIKELKQRVRDVVAPDRDLGHIDAPASNPLGSGEG